MTSTGADASVGAADSVEGRGAFSARIAIALVLVGVVAFSAFLVLSAFASDLREASPGATHAQSKSAIGFAGVVALLQAEGRSVRLSRSPLDQIGGERGVIVLTPGVGQEIPSKALRLARGPDRLVVLPKWLTIEDRDHPGWVKRLGPAETARIAHGLNRLSPAGPDSLQVQQTPANEVALRAASLAAPVQRIAAGPITPLQTTLDDKMEPVLVDGVGRIILGRYNLGAAVNRVGPWLWVLSDPDFLNTQGIASTATAAAGLHILHLVAPGDTAIAFDMTLHGLTRSRNLMKLLLEPPFLPAVLCIVFAAALMGVRAAAGGGVRRNAGRELALGKTGLVENSALLISLARRERGMGRRYAAMMRTVGAAASGVPAGLDEAQQAEMLDAVSRASHTKQPFTTLAADAASAITPASLLRSARALYQWKQELAGGRQRS